MIVALADNTGTSLQGVLWNVRGPWLVLRRATVMQPGAEPAAADGDIVIHRSNVSYLQVVP